MDREDTGLTGYSKTWGPQVWLGLFLQQECACFTLHFFSNNPPLLCGTEKPLFLSGQWSHPSGHQCPGPAPPAPLSFWGSNKTLEVCTLVRPNPEKLGEQLRVWGNGTQEGRPGQWSATSGALPLQAQQVARAPCLSMHAEVGASLPLQGFGDSCLWDAPSPSS